MNKQAVLTKPRHIEIKTKPNPELADHEARIAVSLAGICGTDLAIYKGDYRVPLPLVLGHEFCGRVVEVGAGVDPRLIGRRCTAEINNDCLSRLAEPCEACRRQMPSHCQTRTVLGITECAGAFAQNLIVPAGNVHGLPDAISDEVAVFVEPVAAALQTFEMAELGTAETVGFSKDHPPLVVVLGVGRLGLLVAAVARSLGARVIGVSRSQASLDRAQAFCDEVISAERPDIVVTRIRQQTGQLGADYVVEATASPLGLHFASQIVRPRGVIALKSTPGLPVDRLNLTALVVNEVRLQGSRCGPFDKAIEFIRSGAVDLKPLVTSTYPLDEIVPALEAAAHATKVLVQCDR